MSNGENEEMEIPRVRSRSRRVTSAIAFQNEMMRRREEEYGALKRLCMAALDNFRIPPAPVKNGEVVSILHLHNEFTRLASEIERSFGGESCHVVAMGSNTFSQSGLDPDGDVEDAVPPTLITSPTFRMVATGGSHSLALSASGVPHSWGGDDEGSLGRMTNDGTDHTPGTISGFVRHDGVVEDERIIQISAGAAYSLFLSISGNVYQCGMYQDMGSGKFSDMSGPSGTVEGGNDKPVQVLMPGKGKVLNIYANGSFNAAMMEDFTVVTWGFGTNGELARSAGMTEPGPHGRYELGEPYFYNELGVPNLEIVKKHFLTPKPVLWANLTVKRTVIAVAVGEFHLLVSARDPG